VKVNRNDAKQNEKIISMVTLASFAALFTDYFLFALTPAKIYAIKLAILNLRDLLLRILRL